MKFSLLASLLILVTACGVKVDFNGSSSKETSQQTQRPDVPESGPLPEADWQIDYSGRMSRRMSLWLQGREVLNECQALQIAMIVRKGAFATIHMPHFTGLSEQDSASVLFEDCATGVILYENVDASFERRQLSENKWVYSFAL